MKINLKISTKWWLFCLSLNVALWYGILLVIIASRNGLLPNGCQAIFWITGDSETRGHITHIKFKWIWKRMLVSTENLIFKIADILPGPPWVMTMGLERNGQHFCRKHFKIWFPEWYAFSWMKISLRFVSGVQLNSLGIIGSGNGLHHTGTNENTDLWHHMMSPGLNELNGCYMCKVHHLSSHTCCKYVNVSLPQKMHQVIL